jgi:hypothetical protein
MAESKQITLYTHVVSLVILHVLPNARSYTLISLQFSPFSHRVQLALAELKVPYTSYDINTSDKPEWFVKEVNPSTKKVSLELFTHRSGPPIYMVRSTRSQPLPTAGPRSHQTSPLPSLSSS